MECISNATRNQLTYWCLAFEITPQFQRLLKIQHRLLGLGRAKSRRGGRIEEARYAGLREKSRNGLLIEIRPEGQTGTTTF
jgi:hypothetical protein